MDEEVLAKRRKLDEEDTRDSHQKAKETIARTKVTRQVVLGKNCKLLPRNRSFLQEMFSSTGILSSLGLFKSKFPTPARWKTVFYRIVDSGEGLSKDDWQRVKEIEHETFCLLKESVLKETGGQWMCSIEQNKKADVEVAKAIRTSFMYYERNRKPPNVSYFKF